MTDRITHSTASPYPNIIMMLPKNYARNGEPEAMKMIPATVFLSILCRITSPCPPRSGNLRGLQPLCYPAKSRGPELHEMSAVHGTRASTQENRLGQMEVSCTGFYLNRSTLGNPLPGPGCCRTATRCTAGASPVLPDTFTGVLCSRPKIPVI